MQIVQDRFTLGGALPDAEVSAGAAENFLQRIPEEVEEHVIGQNILPIAQANDAQESGAGMEGGAKARFALGEGGLGDSPDSGFR